MYFTYSNLRRLLKSPHARTFNHGRVSLHHFFNSEDYKKSIKFPVGIGTDTFNLQMTSWDQPLLLLEILNHSVDV